MRPRKEIEDTQSSYVEEITDANASSNIKVLGMIGVELRILIEIVLDCRDLLVARVYNDMRHNQKGPK